MVAARCRSCQLAETTRRTPQNSKEKSRAKHLRTNYNLTPEQVVRMMDQQRGLCAVCSVAMTPPGSAPTAMCVEHSHTTGKVRGLACQSCNKVLAFSRDNPEVLRAAIRYLEAHDEKERQWRTSWQ